MVAPRTPEDVDWASLRWRAVETMRHAYAPHSRFPVGAAALVETAGS